MRSFALLRQTLPISRPIGMQAFHCLTANFGISDVIQVYIPDTLVFRHLGLVFASALWQSFASLTGDLKQASIPLPSCFKGGVIGWGMSRFRLQSWDLWSSLRSYRTLPNDKLPIVSKLPSVRLCASPLKGGVEFSF